MYIPDLSDQELAGRKPAGEDIHQEFRLSLNADSCLPHHPCVIRRKEGTALLELESIIREQLETAGQGVRPFKDKTNKSCKPLQSRTK